eukprot:scaffold1757_cov266-Pinguiococcus_pyrenoidosus.AAC.6
MPFSRKQLHGRVWQLREAAAADRIAFYTQTLDVLKRLAYCGSLRCHCLGEPPKRWPRLGEEPEMDVACPGPRSC